MSNQHDTVSHEIAALKRYCAAAAMSLHLISQHSLYSITVVEHK